MTEREFLWPHESLPASRVCRSSVSGIDPEVDERAVTIADPGELVRELARRKASAVWSKRPECWVLGADQMLYDEHGVWGKPDNPEEHFERLKAMRGQSHTLVTGFCIIPGDDAAYVSTEETRLCEATSRT